jgi:FMN phosphatase YigB (HAD superfamily)
MGRDNHPRERQARQLARKQGLREPFDRVLIVCEGSKTEPLYFQELRAYYRLNTAHVVGAAQSIRHVAIAGRGICT